MRPILNESWPRSRAGTRFSGAARPRRTRRWTWSAVSMSARTTIYYAVSAAEEGSVGDAEGKRVLTKVYEKLF